MQNRPRASGKSVCRASEHLSTRESRQEGPGFTGPSQVLTGGLFPSHLPCIPSPQIPGVCVPQIPAVDGGRRCFPARVPQLPAKPTGSQSEPPPRSGPQLLGGLFGVPQAHTWTLCRGGGRTLDRHGSRTRSPTSGRCWVPMEVLRGIPGDKGSPVSPQTGDSETQQCIPILRNPSMGGTGRKGGQGGSGGGRVGAHISGVAYSGARILMPSFRRLQKSSSICTPG